MVIDSNWIVGADRAQVGGGGQDGEAHLLYRYRGTSLIRNRARLGPYA